MDDIDQFANSLLEEAKRLLEKASETQDEAGRKAYLHASLMLAFSSLEAHVNAVADEVVVTRQLSPHEVGVLSEKDVVLDNGEFQITKRLKISRLEDRILLLHRLGSGQPIDITGGWKRSLAIATALRNDLTHPKKVPDISPQSVRNALEAVIETIDVLYNAIFRKPFPKANRGLQSKLSF